MSAKMYFVMYPGVKKEIMFWQRMEGGRSYSMFWMVSLVASTLASSFPASGPSWLPRRLQNRKQEGNVSKNSKFILSTTLESKKK